MRTIEEVYGKCVALNDDGLEAIVAPGMGMSLIRFSVGGEQLLDLDREQAFPRLQKGIGSNHSSVLWTAEDIPAT